MNRWLDEPCYLTRLILLFDYCTLSYIIGICNTSNKAKDTKSLQPVTRRSIKHALLGVLQPQLILPRAHYVVVRIRLMDWP